MSNKDNKKVVMQGDDGGGRVKTLAAEFPSNSHSSKKKEDIPEKQVKKVIKGTAIQKKKSLGKKMAETFIDDDFSSVSSYILYDVLIPAAKATISDMVSGGIEMMLFGESRKSSRTRRDRGKSYVSYSSLYNKEKERPGRREPSIPNRSRHNFDDVILASRGEAEEVLSYLVELIDTYGQATVADLYDLVGITTEFTDDSFGWRNLSTATVSRVRAGYLINLPRTMELD